MINFYTGQMVAPYYYYDGFSNKILIYEGLFIYENNWRCIPNPPLSRAPYPGCRSSYDYPEIIRNDRFLYDKYVDYFRPTAPPYYWAGLWYWGANNQWILAQSDSNYL